MKHLLYLGIFVAGTAFAHHGWSEYDSKNPLELTGTIKASGYEHPHGFVHLKTADKDWRIVLAPPSRMERRGLTQSMLTPGNKATVQGYPHRSESDELRAERIVIDGKTVELR